MGFSPLGALFLLSDRLATWEFACSAPRCRRRPSVVSDVASPLRVSASCRKGELSRACSHVALYPGGLSRVRILLTDITQHTSVAEIVPHSGRSILQKRTWLLSVQRPSAVARCPLRQCGLGPDEPRGDAVQCPLQGTQCLGPGQLRKGTDGRPSLWGSAVRPHPTRGRHLPCVPELTLRSET